LIDIQETFERHIDGELLQFDRVECPLHKCPDIAAFLLLETLVPSLPEKQRGYDIVECAEHDQIWLSTDVDKLAEVATEADIITLLRCGVFYDDTGSLSMFV
jgi:hypothetical protein